jgi:serine/threonine protein kinase
MITAPSPTNPPSRSGSRRANALPSGHLLDEYRVEAILGAGGFGVTYKALDTHLETRVAIKEYFPVEWSFRDADGVTVYPNTQGQTSAVEGQESDYYWGLERFLDEARVLARIQHPFVVRVKRYFRAHGTAYIVMDYEEGEPLSAILRDGETFDEIQIRGLLEDVLPALQAVHEQGYLHRDIKPANLYLRSSDHRVMLIDFGAARAAVGRHSRSVTSLVTPGYSPPEQYTTRTDRYGTWTDLYALGAVLYRCVTGHIPMEAAERLLDDLMEPALQAGAGRYSTNLLRVIDRALAVRPERRFRTVAEMQVALDGAWGETHDETHDETVILPPFLAKSGTPARETGPPLLTPPPTGRPVMPAAEQGIAASLLEIKQPPVDRLPPADSPHPIARPAKPVGISGRRPPLGLLAGGAVVAVLAAATVWFWPDASTPNPTSPPRYSLYPSGALMERISQDEAAAAGGEADDSVSSPEPSSLEPSSPDAELTESTVASTEPDTPESESVQGDGTAETSAAADDATARVLTESADEEAAAAEATESGTAETAGGTPMPAATPAREATARSRPQRPSQGKTELRLIVVTPPEWLEKSRARSSRDPWQPPTDTGFNQK